MNRSACARSGFATALVLMLVGCPTDDGAAGETTDISTASDSASGGDVLSDTGEQPDDVPLIEDSGPDIAVDSGPVIPGDVDCSTQPGGPFCPCVSDDNCESSSCILTAEGSVCAAPCTGGCLPGWSCQNLSPPGAGADENLVCTDRTRLACAPCNENSECSVPGFEGLDECRSFDSEGSFCVTACTGDGHCKSGYRCEAGFCEPTSGVCSCSPLAISLSASTNCSSVNEIGSCPGSRECGADGLTQCDGKVAAVEACDGQDNDCNGSTDENLADQECESTNEHGTCAGTETCSDGGWVCDAQTAEAEVCDGADNDCDGLTDEDFPDVDLNGVADCVDGDIDGDTVLNDGDNCVFVANTDQLDTDGDQTGDVCDADDDNDNHPDDVDCAPLDQTVFPGADEVCDGKDNDCDSVIDEKACDDDNACTEDVCDVVLGCSNTPNTAACSDGDQCTENDQCDGGQCAGTFVSCDDNNPCTDDACDPAGGCLSTNNTAPCDDGNLCTTAEQCQSGVCIAGGFTQCDDGGPCVLTVCDPDSGCQPNPVENPCNDGDPCTTQDQCSNGSCVGGEKVCDDDNPCTLDTCDSSVAGGCVFSPSSGAACADGLECTINDVCDDGVCGGEDIGCDCETDLDCVDDGDLCNGTLVCDTSGPVFKCVVDPQTVVTCEVPDGLDDACVTLACDPADGTCSAAPASEAESCDDDDICTENDACAEGVCEGSAKICDDGNSCTVGLCDEVDSCVYSPVAGFKLCDDGNACTTQDACDAGFCAGEPGVDCDDDNPCTNDVCDPTQGCVSTPNSVPCNDDNACTVNDACGDGACTGVTKPCNDGDACNGEEACDTATGCYDGLPLVCDDEVACTLDQCLPSTGCVFTPDDSKCDDGEPCTGIETCDSESGCLATPPGDGASCSDGDACTTLDSCTDEVCSGIEVTCDDNNVCTTDACNPGSGCVFTAVEGFKACDDGDACTSQDQCDSGFCAGVPQVVCDDDNPCTDDTCNDELGCEFTPNLAPCDDGDACTFDDTCSTGSCGGDELPCNDGNACNGVEQCDSNSGCIDGLAPVCDDGIPCTADSCQPANGCFNNPNNAQCDDGVFCNGLESCDLNDGCVAQIPENGTPCNDDNACTASDVCQNGGCAGTVADCDDGNACTNDNCDETQGCVSVAVVGFKVCTDGNECTVNDACDNGFCVGGGPPVCDDGNPCTDDGCSTQTGCIFPFNDAPCTDGKACTTQDTCVEGNCVGTSAECDDGNACNGQEGCDQVDGCTDGIALTCDDGIPCTQDTCSATEGCKHLPNHAACDDGRICTGLESCDTDIGCISPLADNGTPCNDDNQCTVNDACTDGLCFGALKECNDLNECTADACEEDSGCVFTPVSGFVACDDGDACTGGDQCSGGVCTGSTGVACDDSNPCTDDICDELTGCSNVNNANACDDGNACTTDDVCVAGTCSGVGGDCAIGSVRLSTPSVGLVTSGSSVTVSGSAGQSGVVGESANATGLKIRFGFHAR